MKVCNDIHHIFLDNQRLFHFLWHYYWPSFSHIGEQAVLQQEIYCTNDAKENEKVFGYQERYSEYRYKPSTIVGKLRSGTAGSLDAWHLAQHFTSAPTLS